MLRWTRSDNGVPDLRTLATSACARRSRGPKQKTLRREFTSACRSSARWRSVLARGGRRDRGL